MEGRELSNVRWHNAVILLLVLGMLAVVVISLAGLAAGQALKWIW